MIKQVRTNYLGIRLSVDHSILKWGSRETCESGIEWEEYLWNRTNRAEVESDYRVKLLEGTTLVPKKTPVFSAVRIHMPPP